MNVEAGATGTLAGLHWDAFYNHGESRLKVTNPNNTDNAKYLASLDAVIAPPGTTVNGVNVAGSVVCWVTTQPQFAGLYPGCVPTNITDPNGPSVASYNYLKQSTSWTLKQKLDNIGASIGGGLWGLGLPMTELQNEYDEASKATLAGALAAAKLHARPERASMILVGDRAKIEAKVRDLKVGEVVVVDTEGRPASAGGAGSSSSAVR